MAKRFDIHEWQAKQRLAEQEEFTPDLEKDALQRAKIQQMMSTEKGLQKDDYKLVNSISNVADMYSYGEILDALESFYIKNDEQPFAEMARKHAKEFRNFLDSEDELNEVKIKKVVNQSMNNNDIGKLQDVISNNDLGKILNTIAVILDRTGDAPEGAAQMIADLVPKIPEEELDEANVTGTGASFTAGTGGTGAYATPKAFSKGKKKKPPYRKSGYMGYSEPVNEAHGLDKDDVNALKDFMSTHLSSEKDPNIYKILRFVIDSNIKVDQTKDLSKGINEQQSLKDI